MLTDPKLRSQVDRIWDTLWTGGLSNPMDAIEQFSYLLFLNRDIVMSANLLGKGATVVLMATLVAYTIGWSGIGYPLVWLGTVLVVSSGLVYARNFVLLVARLAAGRAPETGPAS